MGLRKFLGASEELGELVANLIRVGEVTSVNAKAFTARVRFIDRDDVESYDLRLIVPRSLKNKFYTAPDVGEPVLCLFLPTGVEAGFIVGSYYTNSLERPAAEQGKTAALFEDGTLVEYDRATHRLLVDASASSGAIEVLAATVSVTASDSVQIDAPQITLNGALAINGDAVTHNGVNIGQDHKHIDTMPGTGETGVPAS